MKNWFQEPQHKHLQFACILPAASSKGFAARMVRQWQAGRAAMSELRLRVGRIEAFRESDSGWMAYGNGTCRQLALIDVLAIVDYYVLL